MIPPQVAAELSRANRPMVVQNFIADRPSWLNIRAPSQEEIIPFLQKGETAAISLATELKADLILIDEMHGRRVAAERKIPLTGTIGVLEMAARADLLDIEEAFDRVKRTDFWISPKLLDERLRLFDESATVQPPLVHLEYAKPTVGRARPIAHVFIAFATLVAAMAIGAGSNAINGLVSREYFMAVMGWPAYSRIWLFSVEQGILEGFVCGLIFSVIFTSTIAMVSRGRCTLSTGLKYLLFIMLIDCSFWLIGGTLGVCLAKSSPGFFQQTFIGVPNQPSGMLRYAWVGGSIWGAEPGGLLALTIGLIVFKVKWKRALLTRAAESHVSQPYPYP